MNICHKYFICNI